MPCKAIHSLFRDNGNHDQARNRVGPPEGEDRVQKKPGQEYGRKIGAELGLPRIRVHGRAAERVPHSSLRARKEWHHDQFVPGTVKVEVATPDGLNVETEFDLEKLK